MDNVGFHVHDVPGQEEVFCENRSMGGFLGLEVANLRDYERNIWNDKKTSLFLVVFTGGHICGLTEQCDHNVNVYILLFVYCPFTTLMGFIILKANRPTNLTYALRYRDGLRQTHLWIQVLPLLPVGTLRDKPGHSHDQEIMAVPGQGRGGEGGEVDSELASLAFLPSGIAPHSAIRSSLSVSSAESWEVFFLARRLIKPSPQDPPVLFYSGSTVTYFCVTQNCLSIAVSEMIYVP